MAILSTDCEGAMNELALTVSLDAIPPERLRDIPSADIL